MNLTGKPGDTIRDDFDPNLLKTQGPKQSPFQKFSNTGRVVPEGHRSARLPSRNELEKKRDSLANSLKADPAKTINLDTIELAKVAIREKSPSYLGNKLVSQIGMHSEVLEIKQQEASSRIAEEKVKAEMNMHVL